MFASGFPLLCKSSPLIIVEEPIRYALKPTTGLSSIMALSTMTPLVLTSNAEKPNPEVLAFKPPVPRISKSSKTAWAGILLNWLWLYCSTITPRYMLSSITTLWNVGLVTQLSVICRTKIPLSDRWISTSVINGLESSIQIPVPTASVAPEILLISRFESKPPELPQ